MGTLTNMLAEAFLPEMHDELNEMANLSKERTNLSVIVWVQVNNPMQHNSPRIKFNNSKSNTLSPDNLVPISISDDPHILSKPAPKMEISSSDFENVRSWIILNKDVLLKYWNAEIDTVELISKLKKFNPTK